MFPLYIRVSPRCWVGHDWHRWAAHNEVTDRLEPYGFCFRCGKERFFCETTMVTRWALYLPNWLELLMPWKNLQRRKMTDFWFETDLTLDGLDVFVLDDDLYDYISEYADINTLEVDELYELFEDWVFEGVN